MRKSSSAGEELRGREDDGAAGAHAPDAFADLVLGAGVDDRMRGHVEEEEVALLGAEDALVHQAFGQAFPHLF